MLISDLINTRVSVSQDCLISNIKTPRRPQRTVQCVHQSGLDDSTTQTLSAESNAMCDLVNGQYIRDLRTDTHEKLRIKMDLIIKFYAFKGENEKKILLSCTLQW